MHNITSPSTFVQVALMNEAFGNPRGNPHSIDWARIEKQAFNIAGNHEKDEYGELLAAVKAKDVDAARDAFADIIVFALGGFHLMGFNGDDDITEVLRAVMTRFCRDRAHLADTVQHYTDLGVKVYCGGEFPRAWVKSERTQTDKNGERYAEGKFLKALGYEQPKLKPAP